MSGSPGPEPALNPQSPWVTPGEVLVLNASSLESGLVPTPCGALLPTTLPSWWLWFLPPVVSSMWLMKEQMKDAKQSKGDKPVEQGNVLSCMFNPIQSQVGDLPEEWRECGQHRHEDSSRVLSCA